MAATPDSLDLCETASEKMALKFSITRRREFSARMWLVMALLRVVGWVSPMAIEVEMVGPDA